MEPKHCGSRKQHAESIQVLMTDMILPKMSGAELAREVAEMSPDVLTLYISGYTDRGLIDYDPDSPTVGFLQKPFALRTLLEKLGAGVRPGTQGTRVLLWKSGAVVPPCSS